MDLQNINIDNCIINGVMAKVKAIHFKDKVTNMITISMVDLGDVVKLKRHTIYFNYIYRRNSFKSFAITKHRAQGVTLESKVLVNFYFLFFLLWA